MSSFREELSNYLSIPGACCLVAGGWLYLAGIHCNEEARRVSQAYVLDSLSGEIALCTEIWMFEQPGMHACMHLTTCRHAVLISAVSLLHRCQET